MGEQLQTKYLLIGGGVASAHASVGIREIDPGGSVIIVGQEDWYPYDRPPLSKGFLLKDISPEDIESKDPSFYKDKNIQVIRGQKVISLDATSRKAMLEDGSEITFEKALLATGSTPIRPNIPGIDLQGVHLLRTVDDSMAIKQGMQSGKAAVMVGAGYIGMEVGSGCISKGMKTSIIDPSPHPWSKFASPATGEFLRRYYEQHGASMLMGDSVSSLLGNDRVQGVQTKAGKELPAELVVVGVGVRQNLDLAREAGLRVDDKHGVLADEYLRTSDPNIYVAGDIAAFEDVTIGRRWHAEHYLNGQWQGKQAGRNLAGANERYDQVAYFFSDILDLGMILRGDPETGKSAKTFGSMEAADFVELYAREDGSLAMGMGISTDSNKLDPWSDKLEALIKSRARVDDLKSSDFGF